MPRSPLLAVRISPELRADLDAEIEETGKSQSEIVIKALTKHLKSKAKKLVRGRPKMDGY